LGWLQLLGSQLVLHILFVLSFTVNRVLGLNVKFISVILKISSAFHKNYEQTSITLILRRKHYTIKNKEKVSENENGKRRGKSEGGHSLLRPRLNVQEVKTTC
jgi:hypothetical protein